MRRPKAALLSLALGIVVVPTTSGATVFRATSSGLGAMAFLQADDGVATTFTTMALVTNAIGDDGQPLPDGTFFIGQDRIDNVTGELLSSNFGRTSGLPFAPGPRLTGAEVDTTFIWQTCDGAGSCSEAPVTVHAEWVGVGKVARTRNMSFGGTSRQFQTLVHDRSVFRFAEVGASVDGIDAGSLAPDSRGILVDATESEVDIFISPTGLLSAASVLPISSTAIPPTQHFISVNGSVAIGEWVSIVDDIEIDTRLVASSQASTAQGSQVRTNAVTFNQAVYKLDQDGNQTPLIFTFVEGVADRYVTDAQLKSWSVEMAGPVTTCVFLDPDDPVCVDDTATITGAWQGTGPIDRSHTVTISDVSGQLTFNTRRSESLRSATPTGSLDGATFAGDAEIFGRIQIVHAGEIIIQH